LNTIVLDTDIQFFGKYGYLPRNSGTEVCTLPDLQVVKSYPGDDIILAVRGKQLFTQSREKMVLLHRVTEKLFVRDIDTYEILH